MKRLLLITYLLLCVSNTVYCAETPSSVRPGGKGFADILSNGLQGGIAIASGTIMIGGIYWVCNCIFCPEKAEEDKVRREQQRVRLKNETIVLKQNQIAAARATRSVALETREEARKQFGEDSEQYRECDENYNNAVAVLNALLKANNQQQKQNLSSQLQQGAGLVSVSPQLARTTLAQAGQHRQPAATAG